jgi:hypothetical protein
MRGERRGRGREGDREGEREEGEGGREKEKEREKTERERGRSRILPYASLRVSPISKKPQYVYFLLRPGSWRVNFRK